MKQTAAHSERPIIPGAHPVVDLTQWAGKTYREMDRLFSEFSQADPPVIGPYGICAKITFVFQVKDLDAKIKQLVCDLDQAYEPEEALHLLGLPSDKPGVRHGNVLVFSPVDRRIASEKCVLIDGDSALTKHIEVTFSRKAGTDNQD